MKIDPGLLPKASRKGIFEKVASYDSWIRFSNGSNNGEAKHDLEADVRGMAIKLMNVPGTPTGTHDFLLANMKEFFSKNGSDYADLVKTATHGNGFDFLRFAATHPVSAQRLFVARIKMGHPLQQDFHSSVPFKLGTHSVRYHAQPCETKKDPIPGKDAPRDYLRQRLGETLARRGTCFSFYVQLNQNPAEQIVEDPRKSWDEKTSPFIKVADLEIHKQADITSTDLVNFCENVRFNPWHAHPDNRPLGQINRIRALVYREISRYRHEKNGIAEMEPVNHSPCIGDTSQLCRKP
jgi:catalase